MNPRRIDISICILFINLTATYAQNLVPNFSFEVDTACPMSGGQIYYATPWIDPTNSSSDYFNSCSSPGNYDVPFNGISYQSALDGNAYAGLAAYYPPLPNFREYLQVKLNDTLIADSCYRLIYYVSIAEQCTYGINKLSAFFSASAVTCASCFLAYPPQINYTSPTVIGDSSGWFKVEGVFQAQGNEEYMTIGNFNTDSNIIATIVNSSMPNPLAYYLIDSVSLVKVTCPIDIGIDESQQAQIFNVFPNPSVGDVTFDYSFLSGTSAALKLYDVSGRLIRSYNLSKGANNRLSISEGELRSGIYFYSLILDGIVKATNKLAITKDQ
jgi:hypothetical protein